MKLQKALYSTLLFVAFANLSSVESVRAQTSFGSVLKSFGDAVESMADKLDPTLKKSAPEPRQQPSKDVNASDETKCERDWPRQTSASSDLTKRCAKYWAGVTELDDFQLDFDPINCSRSIDAFEVRHILQMQTHLENTCPKKGEYALVCKRASETLRLCENNALLRDHFLEKLLAGRGVTCEVLVTSPQSPGGVNSRLQKSTLRILRNAPFARHGRSFKSGDLQDYFYGPVSVELFRGMQAPAKPKGQYNDRLLTRVDKRNVACIRGVETKFFK